MGRATAASGGGSSRTVLLASRLGEGAGDDRFLPCKSSRAWRRLQGHFSAWLTRDP